MPPPHTPSSNSPSSRNRSDLESGFLYLQRKEYANARAVFRDYLAKHPSLFPDTMIQIYHRFLLWSTNVYFKVLLAELFLTKNHYTDALCELKDAIDITPDCPEVYRILGYIYRKNQEKETIQALFKHAFYQPILDATVISLLPQMYMENHAYDDAIQFYTTLIKNDTTNVGLHKTLASLYEKTGDLEKAAKTYIQIIRLSPTSKASTIRLMKQLTQQAPHNETLLAYLVQLYIMCAQPDKMCQAINQWMVLAPKKKQPFIDIYKRALGLFPEHRTIMIHLSKLLIDCAQYSNACNYLQRCIRSTQTDDDLDQIVHMVNAILDTIPNQAMAKLLTSDIEYRRKHWMASLHPIEQLIDQGYPETDELISKLQAFFGLPTHEWAYATYLYAKICYNEKRLDQAIELLMPLGQPIVSPKAPLLLVQCLRKKQQYSTCFHILFALLKKHPDHDTLHTCLSELQNTVFSDQLKNKQPLPSDTSQHNRHFLKIGLLNLRMGNVLDAITGFQKISDNHTLKCQSQILVGRAFMEIGRFDIAANQLSACLNHTNLNQIDLANNIRYLQSICLFNQGMIDSGLGILNQISEYDVTFKASKLAMAYYQSSNKNVLNMIMMPLRSLIVDQPYVFTMGSLLAHQIIAAPPTGLAYAHYTKAIQYTFQRNYPAAKHAFLLAYQLDPSLVGALFNLAVIQFVDGDKPSALEKLDQIAKTHSSHIALPFLQGVMCILDQQMKAGIDKLEEATEQHPSHIFPHLFMGDAYFERRNIKRAYHHWHQAAKAPHLFLFLQRRSRYMIGESFGFLHWASQFNPLFRVA